MPAISPGQDGFYHPASEEEITQLILRARSEGLKVRVSGSAHSVAAAIYAGAFRPGQGGSRDINILLDRMTSVQFDDARMQVTVQAGCHLGKDPGDPSHSSTIENSLFYQLDRHGWAFPDTGGIIHQTVAGFLSTGSSGGSVQHSVGDQIVAIRLVDGAGRIRTLTDAGARDEFLAAGVSMGLLGVVTAVTFQCVKTFHVIGQETSRPVSDCGIDLFGPGTAGTRSLEQFLRATEHARLLWWPQRGVRRVKIWQGRAMQAADYTDKTGPPNAFRPRPYREFPMILGSNLPAQLAGSAYYCLIRYWNTPGLLGSITRGLVRLTLAPVIRLFVAIDGPGGPQRFWDSWWRALPMDNEASDRLMPTWFTEMWFPLDRTVEVMRRLRDHFEGGLPATGTYACEIYATRRSRFWMSPAWDRDVVKIDMFWFGHNAGDPAMTFYPQFWKLLEGFDYRFHWGKFLRDDSATYLRPRCPNWDNFMRIRAASDPDQVFVTDYWRKHLGIPPR